MFDSIRVFPTTYSYMPAIIKVVDKCAPDSRFKTYLFVPITFHSILYNVIEMIQLVVDICQGSNSGITY